MPVSYTMQGAVIAVRVLLYSGTELTIQCPTGLRWIPELGDVLTLVPVHNLGDPAPVVVPDRVYVGDVEYVRKDK